MAETFSQVARESAARYATQEAITSALEVLGAKADLPLDELDVGRRLALTGQFVRGLRNIGVADATRLEHDLFEALDAAPTSRRGFVVKDAISLVTVRNHIQQLTTALGVPWSQGMQVQSAISDVVRFLSQHGGGRIETLAYEDSIHVEVWSNQALGYVSLEFAAQTPTWLVAVASLARDFRARRAHEGTHLEFSIDMRTPKAA